MCGGGGEHKRKSESPHYLCLGELGVLLRPIYSRWASAVLAQTSALGKDSEGKICPVGY